MNQPDTVILVFLKPFEAGYVKTRLAATIGDGLALKVYRHLVNYTLRQLYMLDKVADVILCYSQQPTAKQHLISEFPHMIQKGDDLGSRMLHALEWAHIRKYNKKIIIGTDCFELTTAILEEAIKCLSTEKVVIGPAKDGGYYLIGMNAPHVDLFTNIPWSTSEVFTLTKKMIEHLKLDWVALPTLTDIDREQDLLRFPELSNLLNL
jgi:uncharacterized protein